jgi:hypothetical protein
MPDKKKVKENLLKGVLLAYFILILHVLLIAGLGLLVFFLHAIINYMIWILLGGFAAIFASGYLFYKRMKREGRTLREMLKSPNLKGRSIEVNVLGGLASFKIGQSVAQPSLDQHFPDQIQKLEDPRAARLRELTELARLLENNLITLDEYNQLKKKVFES